MNSELYAMRKQALTDGRFFIEDVLKQTPLPASPIKKKDSGLFAGSEYGDPSIITHVDLIFKSAEFLLKGQGQKPETSVTEARGVSFEFEGKDSDGRISSLFFPKADIKVTNLRPEDLEMDSEDKGKPYPPDNKDDFETDDLEAEADEDYASLGTTPLGQVGTLSFVKIFNEAKSENIYVDARNDFEQDIRFYLKPGQTGYPQLKATLVREGLWIERDWDDLEKEWND